MVRARKSSSHSLSNNCCCRLLVIPLVLAGAARLLDCSVRAESPREYQIGDTALEDITAPSQLVVINREETAALKEKEALKVQVICRYNTNVARVVEEEFHAAFASTKSNFLNAVDGFYNRSTLDEQAVAAPKFRRLVTSVQRANRSFPLTTNIARVWAMGESDSTLESSLAGRLREAMSQRLRVPELPQGLPLTYNLRMVPVGGWDEAVTVEMAEKRGKLFPRTNLVIIGRARSEMRSLFTDDPAVGKFLGGLMRTNCVVDADLTRQVRAKHTEALWAADRYEPGQVIVQRGQVIDKKIKAALDELHEKTAAENLQQLIVEDQTKADQRQIRNRWIGAGSIVLFLVLVTMIWRLARRRSEGSLLPARVLQERTGAIVVECPSCEETIMVPHVTSEFSSAKSNSHQWLLPHLARILKDKLVGKLLTQRSTLLETQEKAAADVAELEERLAKIHAPLQERLRAYEQRILDLERELAQKGEENRELIRAKIQLTKEHMEAAKDWVEFN